MQTPFFGFSIILHLTVIFIYRIILLIFKPKKIEIPLDLPTINHKYISLSIMIVVLLIVSTTAVSMITLSYNNQYSTPKILDNYFNEQKVLLPSSLSNKVDINHIVDNNNVTPITNHYEALSFDGSEATALCTETASGI